jgi:purine-binding chemotaxis protein CheW
MKKEVKAILKNRAMEMAREPEEQKASSVIGDFLIFALADETYGIESAFVSEVYSLRDFTPLPGVPSFVLGIINVRGKILPVVDLKRFFNLSEEGLGELKKVIIVHNQNMELGILADSISRMKTFPYDAIEISPVSVTGIGSDYIKGIATGNVIILDGEKILNDKMIIIHEEVT